MWPGVAKGSDLQALLVLVEVAPDVVRPGFMVFLLVACHPEGQAFPPRQVAFLDPATGGHA